MMKAKQSKLLKNRRGWVVWAWGKLGGMMVFMAMMVMFLAAYAYASAATDASGANKLSAALRDVLSDAYNSVGGMSFSYELPGRIGGIDYSLELLNKSGDAVGIIVRSKSGLFEILGGSSLSAPLSEASFGELKSYGGGPVFICITKSGGRIVIERSECS